MIRFRLREMIIDREFTEGHRIALDEIARATGIHRTTLSRIAGQRGYNTTTDNIDKLCRYFKCQVEQLMEYVPDEQVSGEKGTVAKNTR
ncbi:MAG: helix-turn-helix transcriptional regulator [Geobacteraceae bacterium]|jgi:DNA-binding Xre family transcriptional regulator